MSETLTVQQRVPASQGGRGRRRARRGWPASTCWPAPTRARSRPPTSRTRTFPTAGFARRRPRPAISAPAASTCRAPARRLPPSRSAWASAATCGRPTGTRGCSTATAPCSPRAAATWALRPTLLVRGSLGWSFRAPTLNERYRGFRAGNVVTQPNPLLTPEHLRSIEGGVAWLPRKGALRVTVFRNDLDDAVTNVTITTTPDLITRRRQNVGGIDAWGSEVEGEWRLSRTCDPDRRTGPDAVALRGLPAARRTDGAAGAHVAGQRRRARHRPARAGAVGAAARVRRAVRRRSQHARARVGRRRRRLGAARRRAAARRSSSISRTCSTTSTKSADRRWRHTASRSRVHAGVRFAIP